MILRRLHDFLAIEFQKLPQLQKTMSWLKFTFSPNFPLENP